MAGPGWAEPRTAMVALPRMREYVELLVAFPTGQLSAGVVDHFRRRPAQQRQPTQRVGHAN